MIRRHTLPALALILALVGCRFPGPEASPTTLPVDTAVTLPSATPEPTGGITPASPPAIPEEAILILEPGSGSRLVSAIHIAGFANPTFEQNLGVRVVLDDGTVIAHTSTLIQSELGTRGPFAADVPFTISGERNAFIQVFDASARDGGITHLNSVGVILAESGAVTITPGSPHPEDIYITSPAPGMNISGGSVHVEGIGIASFEQTLVISVLNQEGTTIASLPVIVNAPDYGLPGTFAIDLPYVVAAEQAGRIVVSDPSVVFSGDVHVSSVEVTLVP
jgi:hypothetical protein